MWAAIADCARSPDPSKKRSSPPLSRIHTSGLLPMGMVYCPVTLGGVRAPRALEQARGAVSAAAGA
jgi:hypothetical protein